MQVTIRPLAAEDMQQATEIWNEVVRSHESFPGDVELTVDEAAQMFREQTESNGLYEDGALCGLYILHPNGFGHTAAVANASYAVSAAHRGKGYGERLVLHSLERAKAGGFTGMQFNAVVCTNTAAIALYLKLGFEILGTVRNAFRMPDGSLRNTLIFLKSW